MSYKRADMSQKCLIKGQICPKNVLYYVLYSHRLARIMRRRLMRARSLGKIKYRFPKFYLQNLLFQSHHNKTQNLILSYLEYLVLQEHQSEYKQSASFLTSLISSVGFPTDNLILLDEY